MFNRIEKKPDFLIELKERADAFERIRNAIVQSRSAVREILVTKKEPYRIRSPIVVVKKSL